MTVQLADWNQRYAHRVIMDNTGCHVWQGSKTSAGYGDVGFQKRHYLIHRVAYEVFVGDAMSATGTRIFSEGDYEVGTLTWGWECFDCGDEETGYGTATSAATDKDYHVCVEVTP